MSLLESCQAVADEVGYTIDSSIIGSTDTDTKRLLAISNRILGEMCELYAWNKLWKSHSFTLSSTVATYALPGDFSHYHFNSFWNTSNRWQLYGPMSPQAYSAFRGLDFDALPSDAFAVRGVTDEELLIYPTPGASVAGQTIIFEYQSNRYARPATWAQGQSVAIGDYTFYDGNYYTATTAGTTGATPPTHTSSTASDGGITWSYYSGAYKEFVADDDEPILSERIFRQGVLERFASIKNVTAPDLFYSQLAAEFGKQSQTGRFSVVEEEPRTVMRAYGGRITFGRF